MYSKHVRKIPEREQTAERSDAMKKFFVQTLHPDGEITLSVKTGSEIINGYGFRDCSDCEYQVFMADEFGKVVPLFYVPPRKAPYNSHVFCNSETGEVVIEGFSPEH